MILQHRIRSWTKSYLCIGAALTHPLGSHPIPFCITGDPPLPFQKLIKCIEPYKDENILGKRIEQSWITLSTTAKMLEKMQAKQKRHYQHWRDSNKFQVGDLVLLKKHNTDKMDLRWEPNYRVIRLTSPWSAVVENQICGKTKCCNVGDINPNTLPRTGK